MMSSAARLAAHPAEAAAAAVQRQQGRHEARRLGKQRQQEVPRAVPLVQPVLLRAASKVQLPRHDGSSACSPSGWPAAL